jgi:methylated-DNA-[protein]-cysteine S-methyltransferase
MTPSAMTYWYEIDSPVGKLLLAGDGLHLTRLCFQSGLHPMRPDADWATSREPFETAIAQLREYFQGRRRRFELPLAPAGTDFQRRVWRALAAIPYGKTMSYGELAHRIGNPRASRAVGLANGANPLPIIVPCHRVIGANGSLTGFGGGLPIKRALLALENALPGTREDHSGQGTLWA